MRDEEKAKFTNKKMAERHGPLQTYEKLLEYCPDKHIPDMIKRQLMASKDMNFTRTV